jgi:RNA polymerase sigma-70 factor (ECF subfamily)
MDLVIQRCLDGDQAAWETIVRTHWRRVFNIAYKFVGRHDQAEDLPQDVFLKLYRCSIPSIVAPTSRPGW